MVSVLPWTVMRRTVSDVVSRPRSSPQLRRTRVTSAMPPPTRSGVRFARRKLASTPEPASGDMRDALGQGWQLSGGAGLRDREVERKEVEIGRVELEVSQRAPSEEEVRQRCATPGDGALQPLHHVAGQRQGALLEPAPPSERGVALLCERGEVPGAGRADQDLGLSGGLGQR